MSRNRRTAVIAVAVAVPVVVALLIALLIALWRTSTEDRNADDDPVGRGEGGFTVTEPSFTISGTLSGQLSPGDSRPLNLSIRNLTPFGLAVTELSVAVQAVEAPQADATHPCTVADFAVRQLAAPYPLTVPRERTTDLTGLGLPSAQGPSIEMLNTSGNQDGCKGAMLRLAYAGISNRSQP